MQTSPAGCTVSCGKWRAACPRARGCLSQLNRLTGSPTEMACDHEFNDSDLPALVNRCMIYPKGFIAHECGASATRCCCNDWSFPWKNLNSSLSKNVTQTARH